MERKERKDQKQTKGAEMGRGRLGDWANGRKKMRKCKRKKESLFTRRPQLLRLLRLMPDA